MCDIFFIHQFLAVVCTGTKPLIIHERYNDELNTAEHKKEYFEQYWYQLYEHLLGCEIIAGNLIIPHQHPVPFEMNHLNDAIANIQIVTGYIYIFDVNLPLNFKSLKMVYGNELFKYPESWSGYDAANEHYQKEYAIFVEKHNETILMPELRYIKNGHVGFKNSPSACVWNSTANLLDFGQFFDNSLKSNVYALDDETFKNCGGFSLTCSDPDCQKCFSNDAGYCQKTTKMMCGVCQGNDMVSEKFCNAPSSNDIQCCPQNSHGGCTKNANGEVDAFHCENGYYLEIDTKVPNTSRKCVKECNGRVINGTDICLANSNACPDYMFSYNSGKECSYHCPSGQEFDPIGNFDINDTQRVDPTFVKYWSGKNMCKRCRLMYDKVAKDFKDDCGIQCVIQSNSLSFVTILNLYPAITNVEDYDLKKLIPQVKFFEKKCRHIIGFLHIDQYSVGYPANAKRLIPEHFRVLTFATGLYGSIRIENTEGYWFAEPFRNLLVIEKPIKGKLVRDQEQFKEFAVTVRYNSDLRTVDLQRLLYVNGRIRVQYNPLYIPPRKLDPQDSTKVLPVFYHVKYSVSGANEIVEENGLDTTRTGKKVTYDSGCTDGHVSFYYKRCIKCGSDEFRTFEKRTPKADDIEELFAECTKKRDIRGVHISVVRDGEELALLCDDQCKTTCTDETPFTCYDGTAANKDKVLDCKGKELHGKNVKSCAGSAGTYPCPSGYTINSSDINSCVRCDSACRTCYGNQKDDNGMTIFAGTKLQVNGCRGKLLGELIVQHL
uniref:Receptor L-domain domain-containing protein n=1 Tax=Panagrolaimus superbus TaxID=310955 RepID=A0A914YPM5_9BILA